jgi:hypothetical protein
VRDANGKSCTGKVGQPHVVTLNLYRLPHSQITHDLGLQLIKLWEHETGHDFKAAIEKLSSHWRLWESDSSRASIRSAIDGPRKDELVQARMQSWVGSGQPLSCSGEARKYPHGTIASEDALWVLSRCLDQYWPNGWGNVCL